MLFLTIDLRVMRPKSLSLGGRRGSDADPKGDSATSTASALSIQPRNLPHHKLHRRLENRPGDVKSVRKYYEPDFFFDTSRFGNLLRD